MREQYEYAIAMSAVTVTMSLLAAGPTLAGSMDPTNVPGPTMHTLEEIYQKVQNLAPQTLQTLTDTTAAVNAGYYATTNLTLVDVDLATGNIKSGVNIFGVAGKSTVVETVSGTAVAGDMLSGKTAYVNGALVTGMMALQTLSSGNATVAAGYYAATNLTQVDADLTAANIKTNVTIFGVVGTFSANAGGGTYSAAVPTTGQTVSYQVGDDGAYQKGVAWPNPRFTVGTSGDATNCVTDNLTGLMWARNANMGGAMSWSNAVLYCETLNYGGQTDWRLPNLRELHSLVDYSQYNPAICNAVGNGPWTENNPFSGVLQGFYWSGTVVRQYTVSAWGVSMQNGQAEYNVRTGNPLYVWPVRGGQ